MANCPRSSASARSVDPQDSVCIGWRVLNREPRGAGLRPRNEEPRQSGFSDSRSAEWREDSVQNSLEAILERRQHHILPLFCPTVQTIFEKYEIRAGLGVRS